MMLPQGALFPECKKTDERHPRVTANAFAMISVASMEGWGITSGIASGIRHLGLVAAVVALLLSQAPAARAASSDASLDQLVISAGTLAPSFDSGTMTYTAVVTNTTATVTVQPTTAPGAAVTVNGTTVVSGASSSPVALSVGANTITLVVTAGNGITQKTYTVTVQRSTPADRDLSALKLSSGSLAPAFDKATIAYTAEVPFTTERITLTPTASAESSVVKVNGQTVSPGGSSDPVDLAVGENEISVVVRAQDLSIKRYTVTVRRASEVDLAGLRLSVGTLAPAFASSIVEYSTTVAETTASLTVTPTAASSTSSVRVNGGEVPAGGTSGEIALAFGANTITILVTAADKKTRVTTVIVTRTPSATVAPAGTNLGGGVWLVRTGDYSTLKVTTASAASSRRLGPDQTARAPLNRLVTARIRGLESRSTYRVSMKINGRWVHAGTVRSGRKGIAVVSALRFENNGRFRLKLTDKAKAKRFLRIVARAA